MNRSKPPLLDRLAYWLVAIFALDRILKLAAVIHFFRRSQPPTPPVWPTVTLLQPITRDASGLYGSLCSRARLNYPVIVQHLLICDADDGETLALVAAYLKEFPLLQAEIVMVEVESNRTVASKIHKLQKALPQATGEVLCFVDDDVALRQHTLKLLVPYLFQRDVGVVFGLPCFTNWQTIWSSLISGLINAQMLLSFVPLTYISDPIRINGHIFAFRREIFQDIGGLNGFEQYIDDEYEIARRVRSHKLRVVQTPLVYHIDNALYSRKAYTSQFKRWFVMPRQAMFPSLSSKEKVIAALVSATFPLPSMIALLALITRRRSAWISLGLCLTLFGAVYALCEDNYLKRHTPWYRWPLLPVIALWTPIQMARTMFLSNEIEWRGQRLRVLRDGTVEIIPKVKV